MTECRYFSGGLIELKCAIRGSLGSLGPREIKKKKDAFVCFQFWGHQRVHWPSLRHTGTLGRLKKKQRVRTDTKCRFTDRHRKEIGTLWYWGTLAGKSRLAAMVAEVGGVFGTLTRERGALEGQNDMCSAARCKNTSLFASMSSYQPTNSLGTAVC